MLKQVVELIESSLGLPPALQYKIFSSLALIACFYASFQILQFVVISRLKNIRVAYQTRKISGYIIFIVGFLVVGRIWFQGIQPLATFLGLFSAGLAITLKDPLVNLAGWGFILWRRPFKVGDRIQIGDQFGDVIDQRVFNMVVLEIGNWVQADQSTGRMIYIPNGKVFTDVVANYSAGFEYIWDEIPVMVTFESDWQKAKEILLAAVAKHTEKLSKEAAREIKAAARKVMIFYNNFSPTVYTSVADSGVVLTMRFLTMPRKRRGVQQSIWEEVLLRFAEHDDIDFAYPTQRFYANQIEGKPGTLPGNPPQPAIPPHG